MKWDYVERVLMTILWCIFSYMVFTEPDTVDKMQYFAGMIAAGAYIRALDAKEHNHG